MNNKPTVTTGIPAYNEEANIKNLLEALLEQKQESYKLKKIIVVSDGSDDRTIQMAKSIKSKLINVIYEKVRKGKIIRQNEILESMNSGILVLLDADTLPANSMFLENLILPILEKKADLVSGRITPLPPSTMVGKIVNFSAKIKNDFFEEVIKMNGVYLCHGRVRAFSQVLSKKIRWPEEICSGEDAYSYFYAITNGFKFYYQSKAHILYRSPSLLSDHLKQSVRFMQTKKLMKNYFEKDIVEKSYQINKNLFFRMTFSDLISNPILFVFYLMIYLLSRLLSILKKQNNRLWEISVSSKKLRAHG